MIEVYKRLSYDDPLRKLSTFDKNSWINIVDPTEKELNSLIKKFRLDRENVMNALDVNETPRIEYNGGNLYVFMRVPISSDNPTTSSFLTIITTNNFITISKVELSIFKNFIKSSKGILTNENSRNLIKLLYLVSRTFGFSVRRIFKEVIENKKNIQDLSNKDILKLVLKEDILNDYNFSFKPMIDIYTNLIKTNKFRFKETDKELIEDLIIDMNQTSEMTNLSLKTISNMRSYYSTTVSNKLNDTITLLTILTVFLNVPLIITGIYGMNIALPLQNNYHVISILLSIVVVVWIVLFIFFKIKKVIN
ncbi:MAG TPA: magnesium transporter CorA family protein [Candidatus Paceibacterota bacterium]|nr:magnesium transporter CorA family protein [Candidatus Paceibacterota bacterium]